MNLGKVYPLNFSWDDVKWQRSTLANEMIDYWVLLGASPRLVSTWLIAPVGKSPSLPTIAYPI